VSEGEEACLAGTAGVGFEEAEKGGNGLSQPESLGGIGGSMVVADSAQTKA